SSEEALRDVLRLAQAMTYKAAVSGLPLGGGKAVIIGDPRRMKTDGLLRAFGRAVEGLKGRYLTAEDVGMTVADMEIVRKETKHVTGTSEKKGGSGDPSYPTAKGVFYAIETCLKELYGDPSVRNRTVAIQGVGKVGYPLGELLATAGARVILSDTDPQRAMLARREFEAWRVEPDEILQVECDVLSPCALGGVLNRKTIPKLRCRAGGGPAARGQRAQKGCGGTARRAPTRANRTNASPSVRSHNGASDLCGSLEPGARRARTFLSRPVAWRLVCRAEHCAPLSLLGEPLGIRGRGLPVAGDRRRV